MTTKKGPDSVPSHILHNKLREAAQRINELAREREQLIKMGNKLRAELLRSKGGRKSASDDATHSPNLAPTIPPSSRSGLRGLEQLQYQLTSKELEYAKRTLAANTDHLIATAGKNTSVHTEKLSLPSKPAEDSGSQANQTSARNEVSPWQPSFSSDDRSSLQEVWKLLDEDSPVVTPRETRENEVSGRARGSSTTSESFTVKGHPSHVQMKPVYTKHALSAKAAGKWKPAQSKAKIRNYNIKDKDVQEGL